MVMKAPDSGYQLFTIDAGYQLRLAQGLSLGLVVYNVTDTGRSTAPLTYGGGLSYGADSFGIHADVYFDGDTNDAKYLFGLAYLLSANFPYAWAPITMKLMNPYS